MQKSLRILIPAVASIAFAASAQAQTALQNGTTVSASTTTTTLSRTDPVNTLDLGAFGTTTTPTQYWWAPLVSRTPTIQSFNGTNVSLSFTGFSGVFSNWSHLPAVNVGDSRNYLLAMDGGSVTLDFSAAQNYFAMRWGSVDVANSLAFYREGQLVASMGGSQLRSILGVSTHVTSTVQFNFASGGFDRVVATGAGSAIGFDFDRVSFAAAPDVAPIPVGGLGGLIAFLGFMGLRRRDRRSPVGARLAYAPARWFRDAKGLDHAPY